MLEVWKSKSRMSGKVWEISFEDLKVHGEAFMSKMQEVEKEEDDEEEE
jgi:hypothetical protein